MKRSISLVLVILLFAGVSVKAEEKTFAIDPVHSGVTFSIRHLYGTFAGRFNSFSGTISGDMDDPAGMSVSAEVSVASVDTANRDRDTHLRASDFLDTELFPTAGFESTGVTLTDERKGWVRGKLTIRDISKEVAFDAEFLGYGPDHRNGSRAGFRAVTTIDRRDFGIRYNAELPNGITVLGNEVELAINIEAIEVAPAETADVEKQSLAQRIDEFKAGNRKPQPKEIEDALAAASEEILKQGGIEGIDVGVAAPDFSLPDARGREVSLARKLKDGPVVLVFYRGEWCPFCNLQLKALEEAYPEMQKLGASLIGIAPQKQEKALFQAENSKLSFPLLSDITGDTMRAYRLLYTIPESMKEVYLNRYGIDLDEYNGDGRWELPVTATFVIGPDGIVKAGLVDMDYTRRMEPDDILSALRKLSK